jgi:hypothetical protein
MNAKDGSKNTTNTEVMIKALRNIANLLEFGKCRLHNWWNAKLDGLKFKCQCERLAK